MSTETGAPKSLRRYVLETSAVLSGILIAFGLDAGWGLMRERTELRESLSTLRREFANTRAQLGSVVAVNERAIQASDEFLRMTVKDLSGISDDSVSTLRLGLARAETFDPGESALGALVSGSILERVPVDELRDLLAGWSGRVNDVREEQAQMWRADAAIRQHLAMSAIYVPRLGSPPDSDTERHRLRHKIEDEQIRQLYGVRRDAVQFMLVEQRGLAEATDRILNLLAAALQ